MKISNSSLANSHLSIDFRTSQPSLRIAPQVGEVALR
jgi:hypothetical protein